MQKSNMSPSSRRAWIEILTVRFVLLTVAVALLAEGVDRNFSGILTGIKTFLSPSSRRAWIEIGLMICTRVAPIVALLAEGVDRNFGSWT